MQIKGILSFPVLFTPKAPKGSDVQKYGLSLLLPGNDPQVAAIQAEVDAAKQNTFPSGFPNSADVCFDQYDIKYAGKDYYDPRFSGWYVFSCSAKAEDKPAVVDGALKPVMDPGLAHSGAVVWINAGISGYTKGTGGVGGWLNGVMLTGEEPPMGRLDNKPSVEQMFAGATGAPQAAGAPPHAPNAAPQFKMTDKAQGTREWYHASNWTDEALVANGLMEAVAPVAATPPPPAPNAAPPPAPNAAPPPAPNAAPPPATAPQYQMTTAAQGTREWYHASGWSDVQLVEGGLMLPPGGVTTSFQ